MSELAELSDYQMISLAFSSLSGATQLTLLEAERVEADRYDVAAQLRRKSIQWFKRNGNGSGVDENDDRALIQELSDVGLLPYLPAAFTARACVLEIGDHYVWDEEEDDDDDV